MLKRGATMADVVDDFRYPQIVPQWNIGHSVFWDDIASFHPLNASFSFFIYTGT